MGTPFVLPVDPKPKAWWSLDYWRLETPRASLATRDGWSNEDVDVVAPDMRTWKEIDYLWLWLADGANVGTMQQAGSILALGLSWREASAAMSVQMSTGISSIPNANLPNSAIGNVLIGMTVALNGAIGSTHHVPFSIASRASMGFYFSYFAVVSRLVLGLIYFG
jgi:NCS1 family nucleobase:cation symporter-1